MFEGMYTALVTPFIKKGADIDIDWESYANLIDWQLESGVDGLVLYGTTGESPTLSTEEKVELTKRAIEIVKGRVPLVVGAGSNSTQSTISFVHEIEKLKIDGVLVVAPYYNKPSQEGLYQHFAAVAEASKTPLIVYNVPSRTSVDISIETFKRLAQVPNIAAVKQASDSIFNITELCLYTADKISILAGDDPSTAYLMMMGGKGVISASGSVIPKEMCEIVKASEAGDWSSAARTQKELAPKIKAIFAETNPTPAKAVLAMKKIIKSDVVRLPLVPVSESTRVMLKQVFDL